MLSSSPQLAGVPTPTLDRRPEMSKIRPPPRKFRKVIPAPKRRQSSVAYPKLPRARRNRPSVTRTASGTVPLPAW
jgi:hypothetical protein